MKRLPSKKNQFRTELQMCENKEACTLTGKKTSICIITMTTQRSNRNENKTLDKRTLLAKKKKTLDK